MARPGASARAAAGRSSRWSWSSTPSSSGRWSGGGASSSSTSATTRSGRTRSSPRRPTASRRGCPAGRPWRRRSYWLFQSTHWEVLTLVPFVVVAPLACLGFARLLRGRPVAIGAATLLFSVNPFVDERMANGQVYVVMGYALLPLVLGVVVRPLASRVATVALGGVARRAPDRAVGPLRIHHRAAARRGGRRARGVRRREVVVAALRSLGCALDAEPLLARPGRGAGRVGEARVSRTDLAASHGGRPAWGLRVNVPASTASAARARRSSRTRRRALAAAAAAILPRRRGAATGPGDAPERRRARPRAQLASSSSSGSLLALGAEGPTGRGSRLALRPRAGVQGAARAREVPRPRRAGLRDRLRRRRRGDPALASRGPARPVVATCHARGDPRPLRVHRAVGLSTDSRARRRSRRLGRSPTTHSPGATSLALPWSAYLPVPWLAARSSPTRWSTLRRPVVAATTSGGPIEHARASTRGRAFLSFALAEGPRLREFGRTSPRSARAT